jgi:hypothetical protein
MVAAGVITAPAASAHGGPIGLSVLTNSPSGPLQSSLRVHAVWLGDGDDADGLSVVVQGSGPGTTSASLGGGGGVYQGTIGYPAGGTWTLTVSVVGAPYPYSAAPLVVNVDVEGAPPPTASPTAPPTAAPGPSDPTPTPSDPATTSTPPTTTATPGSSTPPGAAEAAAAGVGPIVVVPRAVGRGAYGIVTFAVPNARADAAVMGVEARFPARQPLLSAQTQALSGWTATVNEVKLDNPGSNVTQRVGSVTWRTATSPLAPGQVELYTVSIGPFPEKAKAMRVEFVQTYSDGTQVTWDARPTRATPHPAHASATIRLTRPSASSSGAPGSH